MTGFEEKLRNLGLMIQYPCSVDAFVSEYVEALDILYDEGMRKPTAVERVADLKCKEEMLRELLNLKLEQDGLVWPERAVIENWRKISFSIDN